VCPFNQLTDSRCNQFGCLFYMIYCRLGHSFFSAYFISLCQRSCFRVRFVANRFVCLLLCVYILDVEPPIHVILCCHQSIPVNNVECLQIDLDSQDPVTLLHICHWERDLKLSDIVQNWLKSYLFAFAHFFCIKLTVLCLKLTIYFNIFVYQIWLWKLVAWYGCRDWRSPFFMTSRLDL